MTTTKSRLDPPEDCSLCPRLVEFRNQLRETHPSWHNAPVPSFTADKARLLIVGLAPGKSGANRTGRPFTGDFAGGILYSLLDEFGFSKGAYKEDGGDGLQLRDCIVANAVACVPPQNKPVAKEISTCRPWLDKRIRSMKQLRAILALGRIAHESVVKLFDMRMREAPFRHGESHMLQGGIRLFDSYHCSRYNIQTKRLNREMLQEVFAGVKKYLGN